MLLSWLSYPCVTGTVAVLPLLFDLCVELKEMADVCHSVCMRQVGVCTIICPLCDVGVHLWLVVVSRGLGCTCGPPLMSLLYITVKHCGCPLTWRPFPHERVKCCSSLFLLFSLLSFLFLPFAWLSWACQGDTEPYVEVHSLVLSLQCCCGNKATHNYLKCEMII